MTPRDKITSATGQKAQARQGNIKPDTIGRIKMLIAAGAVAGTIVGWGLLAHQDVTNAYQSATSEPNVAALVQPATATSAPQITVTLEQALQATATIALPAAIAVPSTSVAESTPVTTTEASTPIELPTATTEVPTDTPEPTATAEQPTAIPTAITRSRSSR